MKLYLKITLAKVDFVKLGFHKGNIGLAMKQLNISLKTNRCCRIVKTRYNITIKKPRGREEETATNVKFWEGSVVRTNQRIQKCD